MPCKAMAHNPQVKFLLCVNRNHSILSFLSCCQICVEICSFSSQCWQMQSHWIHRGKIQSILWHSSGVFNSFSIKIIFNPECIWNLWNPKFSCVCWKLKGWISLNVFPSFCCCFHRMPSHSTLFKWSSQGSQCAMYLFPSWFSEPISVLYWWCQSAITQSAKIGEAFRAEKFQQICLLIEPSASFVPLNVWYLFNPFLSLGPAAEWLVDCTCCPSESNQWMDDWRS